MKKKNLFMGDMMFFSFFNEFFNLIMIINDDDVE